jgi:CheY-like chemotaxis protein
MEKRALVVEECAITRSVIAILLQRNGWEAIGAADGAEALRLASSWHFDLVITAPEPSKVPGEQLLRILRGGLLSPAVRILLHAEDADTAGKAKLLADAILIRDGQIEKQLERTLGEMFGALRPRGKRGSFGKRHSRRNSQCAKPARKA